MRKVLRSSWSKSYYREFIEWHETVISQYPQDIIVELRGYRTDFLKGIPIV